MTERDLLNFSFDINALLLYISNSLIVELCVDQIKFDFGFIVEISESAHHGCYFLNLLIEITMVSGSLVDWLIETELPKSVLLDILAEGELVTDWDCEITIILDHFSEVKNESIVGVDLLTDESSFFEVTVQDLPHVFLGDLWPNNLVHNDYL